MKKITITVGLVAAMLSTNAQDTLCTYFTGKDVYHFDYQQDTILSISKQTAKFYEVNLTYGDVLCLHFDDNKSNDLRLRNGTDLAQTSLNVEFGNNWQVRQLIIIS